MSRLVPSLSLCLCLALLPMAPPRSAHAESTSPSPSKPMPKQVNLSGKVQETMDGGGYTYILLVNGNEKNWVAAPLMKVKVGQQLTLIPGFEMKNFSSKALNRKFDRVVFSAGVVNQEPAMSGEAIKKAHKGVSTAALNAALQNNQAKQAAKKGAVKEKVAKQQIKVGKVAKAKGANGYTVAELYAKRAKLEKKQVVVHGKVVKVSSGIMKKNWVHLQDGSGKASSKNNDIVFTSTQAPKEGDVVTASGTLANNRDFGYGYKYAVLVEGARFSK